jgi:transposase-like protein
MSEILPCTPRRDPVMPRRHRDAQEARALLAHARARGLSQAALAEELGVHPDTVHNWARRERALASTTSAGTCAGGSRRSREDTVSFVPVRVFESDASHHRSTRPVDADSAIEIVLERALGDRDVLLRLPRGVDADDLRALLGVITEHSRC